jgi:hypothetical protein
VKPEEIEDVRVAEDQIGSEAVFIAQRSEFLLCQFGRLSREASALKKHPIDLCPQAKSSAK